ncbi:MAG: hypothetical protein PHI32_14900 [Dysgonamonadaceae bacterium]|nr:hypothetical protein [Dysgonamonadaceae bacterium]
MFEDHQARITNIESWDEYISLYTTYSGEASGRDYKSSMMGCVLPKMATIKNLKYNDFHLSCEVVLFNGMITKKLAYLINEPEKLDTTCCDYCI